MSASAPADESRSVLHRCGRCAASYDADEFHALPFIGLMDCGTGYTLELKNCPCGSTMARLIQPAPVDVFDEISKDAA